MAPIVRGMAIAAAASALSCCCTPASAADLPSVDRPALQPRFAVHEPQLLAAPVHASVDDRFRLQAHVQTGAGDGQWGSGLELRAKVMSSPATACGGGVDSIFANGFE